MKAQRIGAYEIARVAEIERLAVDPTFLLGGITPEIIARHRDELGPALIEPGTDRLVLSFHSYVIRTGRQTILVDTCNGNDKERPSMPAWHRLDTPYLANLAAAGVRPEEVDVVLCTHLHADHVGWNTRLENGRWAPTFPRARYVMAKKEFEHFNRMHEAKPEQPVSRGAFADSVLPVVEHGRAVFVEADHVIDGAAGRGVWLSPTHGHTPGHVAVRVQDGGPPAILSGDVIHHPIQFAEHDLYNPADLDRAAARRTRLDLMAECAETRALLLTGHFPAPTAGHVERRGELFRFRFLES